MRTLKGLDLCQRFGLKEHNLILAIILVFSLAQSMGIVVIPLMATQFIREEVLIGLVFALPGVISVLLEIPVAGWSDHFARKPVVLLATICGLVAAMFAASQTGPWGLVVFTIMNALAGTIFFPPILAYLSEIASAKDHAKIQGINGFVQGIASFFGVILAGVLIERFGFGATFTIMALIYLSNILLVSFVPKAVSKSTARYSFKKILSAYKNAVVLITQNGKIQLATLVEMVYIICIVVVGNSFFPHYLTSQRNISPSITGGLVSIRNLASTSVSLLFGKVSRRFGIMMPVILTLLLASVTLLFLPFAQGVIVLGVLSLILGVGVGLIPSAPNIFIAEGTNEDERAVGYASVTLVSRFLQMILAPIFGLLAQGFGLKSVFFVASLAAGIVIILIVLHSRRSIFTASVYE